jgi:hypothetical protein
MGLKTERLHNNAFLNIGKQDKLNQAFPGCSLKMGTYLNKTFWEGQIVYFPFTTY